MGLDQFAYFVICDKENDGTSLGTGHGHDARVENEIEYWRKHNRLEGWMKALWISQEYPLPKHISYDDPLFLEFGLIFNDVPLELTLEDLTNLEKDVRNMNLPKITGFFFGDDSYGPRNSIMHGGIVEYDLHKDLKFIQDARDCIEKGHKVFYKSCW